MWYRRTVLVVLASALTACASGRNATPNALTSAREGAPTRSGNAPSVQLKVQNDNFYDVAIYALVSGVRTRLGTVMSHGRQLLRVPVSILSLGTLQILADPIGSEDHATLEPVSVSPGQTVAVTLMPSLNMSYVSVR